MPGTLPYMKIYSQCLNADVKNAMALAKQSEATTERDKAFLKEITLRFGETSDNSVFLEKRKSSINDILKLYRDYWRLALLNPEKNYDSLLRRNLSVALSKEFKFARGSKNILSDDTLDIYLKKLIQSRELKTTGFGKTGKLFDLLVWRNEKDTTYDFSVRDEVIHSKVVFMTDFVTLGWEEYATLDRFYPGGWATKTALYCVRKAYNLKSESFLISYLCHEARHFSDFVLFPKLGSADLEYRAKLTELSLLNDDLFKIISFFIENSDRASENGHSVANYFAIRNLSEAIFKTEFERDIEKWKKIPAKEIHEASYGILKKNTEQLSALGKDVEEFIKKSIK
ncbi:hypothetical protein WSM22_33660 [Cytophagales bacterium WSM2-2]|nr:hypothetical protein WSM22_33660 [Cytophagales bacterium WSM2-2]